jgi:hypothetical protein
MFGPKDEKAPDSSDLDEDLGDGENLEDEEDLDYDEDLDEDPDDVA